ASALGGQPALAAGPAADRGLGLPLQDQPGLGQALDRAGLLGPQPPRAAAAGHAWALPAGRARLPARLGHRGPAWAPLREAGWCLRVDRERLARGLQA